MVAWMISRLCRLPFNFTVHAQDIYQRRLNPRDLLQQKLNAATFIVTCTKANVEALRALAALSHQEQARIGVASDPECGTAR